MGCAEQQTLPLLMFPILIFLIIVSCKLVNLYKMYVMVVRAQQQALFCPVLASACQWSRLELLQMVVIGRADGTLMQDPQDLFASPSKSQAAASPTKSQEGADDIHMVDHDEVEDIGTRSHHSADSEKAFALIIKGTK